MPIMLVEDEETDVLLVRRALSKGGILNPIIVIRDGKTAVDYLLGLDQYEDRDAHPMPGLILLDINLPRMSGLDVLQHFKGTIVGRRTPVVVLTSSSQPEEVARAYDVGANSYLVKPVTFAAFCEMASAIHMYWLLQNRTADQGE
jgi:CheY-like chemotaxis protein